MIIRAGTSAYECGKERRNLLYFVMVYVHMIVGKKGGIYDIS
jgi:hypothetical protein